MEKKIEKYLKNNDYSGKGLCDYLGKKSYWCASTSDHTSGIISCEGYRYYFACIKPWAFHPQGDITIEKIKE